MKNLLLVTFPVDLGNRTLESNQHFIFKDEMDFFRFASKHADSIDTSRVPVIMSLMYRIQSAFKLRRIVRKYTKAGKIVLFNGLSPALFSFGAWNPGQTAIVFDWTRTLYTEVQGKEVKRNWIFKLHQKVLKSCPKFLCWTDAIRQNLTNVYGVDKDSVHKVHAPFLVEKLNIYPRPTPSIPRVLFIGGELKRKGGDVLLNGWTELLKGKCELTMMTNDQAANIEGINFLPGVKYGTDTHYKTYQENDILILPTRIDAYPQVIGEAAAAGLAVITTKFALGAREVIVDGESGYIADSPEHSIELLSKLLADRILIDQFKFKGYQLMHSKFSKDSIKESYLNVLNSN